MVKKGQIEIKMVKKIYVNFFDQKWSKTYFFRRLRRRIMYLSLRAWAPTAPTWLSGACGAGSEVFLTIFGQK